MGTELKTSRPEFKNVRQPGIGGLALLLSLLFQVPGLADDADDWFESRIRPVLAGTCFRCHGDQKTGGELRVDSRDALLKGGNSGPAIDLEQPSASLLLQAIRREADVAAMPPDASQKLRPEQVSDFQHWLESGAPWPSQSSRFATSQHWAYEPLRQAPLPSVTDRDWPQTTVDHFIRHAQEQRGLQPAPRADRLTLIRRATFDLTGLPPTPAEVADFLSDESPDAFERLVERLLASPRYGERWGRLWLDVVRYADTAGETADYPVPTAWRYRNYVIQSLNSDLPYDQFVREQIAGDILANRQPGPRYADQVTATGYLALSRRFGFDSENYHHLTIHDTIDNLGQAFLGLSLGCARCHDHKFDAVSMRDYYGLYGIFDSSRYPFPGSEQKQRVRALAGLVPPSEAANLWEAHEARIARLATGLAQRGQPVPNALLRWLGEMDGDLELQAPAAGGSYGVLVPPWRYRGPVAVTTTAQSPYRQLYGTGRVGVSLPAAPGPYQVSQALPDWLKRACSPSAFVNLDIRLGVPEASHTGRHRFAVLDEAGHSAVELHFGADGVWLRGAGIDLRVADVIPQQWINLQVHWNQERGELRGQVGHPGAIQTWGPQRISTSGNGRLDRVVFEPLDDRPTPALEFDNLGIRSRPIPPVSTELPELPGEDPEANPARITAELQSLAGIGGDLELQPRNGALTTPWNAGPNSVVRLSPEAQSPFQNLYPAGEQGLVMPNRAEYDGFGVTLPPITLDAEGRLHLGFDFRLGNQAAGGDGSWRFYVGQGAGPSAAIELFFTGREFFRRSADEKSVVAPLQGETWYQVRLVLDTRTRTYRGELCHAKETVRFEGEVATGWDGKITYSFIDSYGHRPGVRPALAVDNFVFQGEPLRPFDALPVTIDSTDTVARRDRIARLQARLAELQSRSEQERQELERLLLEGPFPLAYAMAEGTPHAVHLQLRGEPSTPGEEVPRAFLTALGDSSLPTGTAGSGRLELADWLTRPDHPLLSRVLVNRVWQAHFGQGLVKTSNDFGVRGQPPTDLALLDHLVGHFHRQGWSLKELHRLILNSATWQQQGWLAERGERSPEAAERQVGFARRRLSAEEMRDAILVVTGELDPTPGEAHPFPAATAFGFSQHAPFNAVYEHNRRSVYLMTQRLKRHPFLALFDGPDPNTSTPQRLPTTVPTQALFFLNDRFLHDCSDRWASRLRQQSADPAEQLTSAWKTTFGRAPQPAELAEGLEFLDQYRRDLETLQNPDPQRQALAACLRLLLGSNEFLHLD